MLVSNVSRKSQRIHLIILWLIVFLSFIWMSSNTFLEGDDFLHVGIGQKPYGHFSFREWMNSWRSDYFDTNGRFADALFRLFLRAGVPFVRFSIAVFLTLLLYVVYCFIRSKLPRLIRNDMMNNVLITVVVYAGFMLLLFSHPYFFGNAIGWYSGSFNYLVPTTLILVGLIPSEQFIANLPTPRAIYCLSTLFLVIGQLAHEQANVAVISYFFAFMIYNRYNKISINTGLRIQIGISFFSAAVNLCAPGIRARMNVMNGEYSEGMFQRLYLNLANGSQEFVWTMRFFIVVLLLLAIFLVRRSARVSGFKDKRTTLLIVFCVVGCLNLILMYARRRYGLHGIHLYPSDSEVECIIKLLISTGSILGLLIFAGLLLHVLATDTNEFIRWAGRWVVMIIGSSLIPLAIGSQNVRSYFTTGICMLLLCIDIAVALLTERIYVKGGIQTESSVQLMTKRVFVPFILVLSLFSLVVLSQTNIRASANRKVWEDVERRLILAAREPNMIIEIRDAGDYPYPDYLYFMAYDQGRYEESIRLYYDIPESTRLVWRTE